MLVIHGEYQHDSRNYLRSEITSLEKNGYQAKTLNGETISFINLESEILTQNLFSKDALIIENLLSRALSKEKTKCINFIRQHEETKPIILWEKKLLTKTAIQKASTKNTRVKQCKSPLQIFNFVSHLSPRNKKQSLNLLHQSLKHSSSTFIFIMLAKQISNLIIIKTSPNNINLATWQKSKLLSLAKNWSLIHLKKIHSQLLLADYSIKSGQSSLDLTSHLELLIIDL